MPDRQPRRLVVDSARETPPAAIAKAHRSGTVLREITLSLTKCGLSHVGGLYTNPGLFHTCRCHWEEAIRHGFRPTPVEAVRSIKPTNYAPLYASECPETGCAALST